LICQVWRNLFGELDPPAQHNKGVSMNEIGLDDLVLVAILRERKDLEIARLLGWYRIPLRSAPKMIRVDWIAFYLTGAFGADRWTVRYLAPVLGHELVRRSDLLVDELDHPNANEPYYKINLGTVVQLAHPIPAAKWRRFTFLYTTGANLLHARDVSELTLKSSAQNTIR
jgi:hypothetical protein